MSSMEPENDEQQIIAHDSIHERLEDSFWRQALCTVHLAELVYNHSKNEFMIRVAPTDEAVRIVIPTSLRAPCLITGTIHVWKDIGVKDVGTKVGKENSTGSIWLTTSIRLCGTASNVPKISHSISSDAPYNYLREETH